MDVHNVFLNEELQEKVHMHIPEESARQGESQKVCKLQISLYRLTQTPRQWNLKLIEALLQMGFRQSHFDYSLFIKRTGHDIATILVYVDDLLITSNYQIILDQTSRDLQNRFEMKDLGEL